MENLTLYRKRIIPNECTLLKDDEILVHTEEYIITRWKALKPKKDLHHGYSIYYLKKGIKISKFYKEDESLLYWYCDIVEYVHDSAAGSLTSIDLLADVVIYPNGFVEVIDLDELASALRDGLICSEQLACCLLQLDTLLTTIYRGDFASLNKPLEDLL